ncbi:SURF1 family protein [Noviherbaspirillum aridicola]|uniref:SURF1-like protein n=1 Tax=Noviherbaspirillum aridicola TaxID=2849687 RepID=A0ABQ4Q0Z6_9BURK|nr:SURF1 family protein [Noviherbaspirillum aridicola]GIZ50843.1 SURF1-like protein [Noviherbaspirillum aridicola]
MRLRFRFSWIPFIAALCTAAAGVSLGQWQTRRALEKEAIEARLTERTALPPLDLRSAPPDPDAIEYRRVVARGEFMQNWNIWLDNRPHQGTAGFHLLTPFRMAGSDAWVLVARGWVARNPFERTRLPSIATPDGEVRLEGVAVRHAGRVLQLGEAPPPAPGAIVQNVAIDDVARSAGIRLLPFIVEQTGDMRDGLVRDWPRPSSGADKHRGYAFQWYALAATALLFFVVTGFRRGTSQTKE